ncbi:hypothetical protein G9F32_03010 [Acinetobacter sp. 194]|uniref:hypothetical protein n=1 Tax=Acinetobacter shaoyimingii TaxID=2715164 RepID=UPI00140C51BB|nr:hypothetical protein [Acinetobacter shaoyimingii]NHB57003.1 hypothetical protein [Acinetobacter shaoyimingii]
MSELKDLYFKHCQSLGIDNERYVNAVFNQPRTLLEEVMEMRIDQLKAQLIDQGQRFNDQSQKVRDLEFKCEGLEKRIYSALMLLQRNQLYIPALAMGQIGKVLRGGHE